MKKIYCLFTLVMAFNVATIAQNVGISDVLFTPQSPLHIYKAADGNMLQISNSTLANTGLQINMVGGINFNLINRQAGYLGFYTSNTERMRILSGGNVGIGTTAPTAQLHTTGTVRLQNYPSGLNGAIVRTNSTGDLSITNFSGDVNQVLLGTGVFGTAVTSATAWQLLGNSNTTAGTNFVGTTNAQALDFRTNNNIAFRITSGTAPSLGTGGRLLAFYNGDAGTPIFSFNSSTNTGMYLSGASQLSFSTTGLERLRITSTGMIQAVQSGLATTPVYSFTTDTDLGIFRVAADILGFTTAGTEKVRFSTTEAVFNEGSYDYDFRIESDGFTHLFCVDAATNHIGINRSGPTSVIDFRTTGENIWLTYWENNNAANGALAQFYHTNASNGNRVLMGISNYSGSALESPGLMGLHINGSGSGGCGVSGFSNSNDGTGVLAGFVGGNTMVNGWALFSNGWAGGTTSWQLWSDERIKREVKNIENPIEKIMLLNGVEFYYDNSNFQDLNIDTERKHFGFIAQNVESVFPFLVREANIYASKEEYSTGMSHPKNTYKLKTLSYTDLIPLLLEGIKEQQVVIQNQQSSIESLEQRISELERLVEQMNK
jgi:hypothetical protein